MMIQDDDNLVYVELNGLDVTAADGTSLYSTTFSDATTCVAHARARARSPFFSRARSPLAAPCKTPALRASGCPRG